MLPDDSVAPSVSASFRWWRHSWALHFSVHCLFSEHLLCRLIWTVLLYLNEWFNHYLHFSELAFKLIFTVLQFTAETSWRLVCSFPLDIANRDRHTQWFYHPQTHQCTPWSNVHHGASFRVCVLPFNGGISAFTAFYGFAVFLLAVHLSEIVLSTRHFVVLLMAPVGFSKQKEEAGQFGLVNLKCVALLVLSWCGRVNSCRESNTARLLLTQRNVGRLVVCSGAQGHWPQCQKPGSLFFGQSAVHQLVPLEGCALSS